MKINEANLKLSDTNEQLTKLYEQNELINQRLSEANIIKESYIGTFFGICSAYIDEGDKLLFKILNSGDYAAGLSDEEVRNASKICEKGLRYDLTVQP